jgi:VanZ family protein
MHSTSRAKDFVPVFCMAVILLLTLMPMERETKAVIARHLPAVNSIRISVQKAAHIRFAQVEDMLHCALFGTLAFLWMILLGKRRDWRSAATVSLAITVFFGIADELLQAAVPSRDPSFKDVVMDCLGAVTGVFLAGRIRGRTSQQASGGAYGRSRIT